MFFSIIVPVYNVEKYLRECVDSILEQSFNDFELILVDDGSKDGSSQICDEYAQRDNRVKVMHKTNGGLSDARNVGTSVSNGKYTIFIDSDDYICDGNFLEKVYKTAYNKEPDVICYKFKKYFEDKKFFSECSFECANIEQFDTLAGKINYMVECDAFYCSAWSKAIKSDIIKKYDIQFEKNLLGEDQEWYYHILYHISTITYINETFLVYRQRSNSITSSWKMKNLTDCVYIVKKWYEKLENSELENNYRIALLNSVAKLYCNLLVAYTRFADINKAEYYESISVLASLLKYHNNPRTNMFYKVYHVFGFKGLMFFLKIICKLR